MTLRVDEVYTPETRKRLPRPLFLATVAAGFPSPAGDYVEGKLDLNQHLIDGFFDSVFY